MLRNDYIERLERGGFAKGQAEVQVSVFEDFMRNEVATKKDLLDLEARLELRFREIEVRFKGNDTRFKSIEAWLEKIEARFESIEARFKDLESQIKNLKADMKAMEYSLLIKLGALITAIQIIMKYFSP